MKCDLTPCKKVLYFDEMNQIIQHLLSLGLFVAIVGILTTSFNEYYIMLGIFLVGSLLNKLWGSFFIKPNARNSKIRAFFKSISKLDKKNILEVE